MKNFMLILAITFGLVALKANADETAPPVAKVCETAVDAIDQALSLGLTLNRHEIGDDAQRFIVEFRKAARLPNFQAEAVMAFNHPNDRPMLLLVFFRDGCMAEMGNIPKLNYDEIIYKVFIDA